MNGIKKSFFLRLMLTNLLVITVVLLLILIMQNTLFLTRYKDDLVKGHNKTLQYMQDLIDKEIQGLYRLSNGISVDRDLSYFRLSEEPHSGYTAVQKLRNYYSANTFTEMIALSFFQDSYLYTSEGSYKKEHFLSVNFASDDYSSAMEIASQLDGNKEPAIINSKDSLFFSYQFPATAIDGIGVIIYKVAKPTLARLLQFDIKGNSHYNLIFDSNDDLMVSSTPVADHWIPLIRTGLAGSERLILDDQEYLIQFRRSDISGLAYISLISSRTALAPFYDSRLSLLYSFAIIYVISILLSLAVSRKNYDPFRKMKALLLKGSDGQHIENEVLWMEKAILSMNRIIEDQKMAFSNNTINNLMQSKYESLGQFVSDMEQSGSSLPFDKFGFFIIQVENAADRKEVTSIFNSLTFEQMKIIKKDSIQARQILFLYNTPLPQEDLKHLFNHLFISLKEKSRAHLTLAVGSAGNDIEKVSASLGEAISAMEYKFVIGKNHVIFYSDLLEDRDFERPLSASELDSISFSIYSGDMDQISKVINGIIESHNIRNLSLLNAKTLTYQIANRVLRTIDEILDKKGLPISLSSNIQQYIYLGSVDEMVESIHNIFKDLESLLSQNKAHKSDLTVVKAKEIVTSEFTDARLSVQEIAEKLGVSLSYLSRVFKKNEGKTILAFITEKRIDLAKELLINSDLSVKEIMEDIGYLDLSSFTRKFKSITGYTPGSFRKNRT